MKFYHFLIFTILFSSITFAQNESPNKLFGIKPISIENGVVDFGDPE